MHKILNLLNGTQGKERGNALFLILIAVALFAALSYAVTQSGRGGRDVSREQALIIASQLTQFGASLRTAVTRMIITGETATALSFDTTSPAANTDEVFASAGGGAIYSAPPANSCTGTCGPWKFLDASAAGTSFFVNGIGTDTTTGADVIVYLNDVSETVCDEINNGLGLTLDQVESATIDFTMGSTTKGNANSFKAYSGEAFACTDNNSTGNIYYHVLVER